jgi:preprotein translocase subunit SecG
MGTAILIIHILVAIGIIGLVLIQHGKGADAGAAFGAGAAGGVSGSVFGAKGSSNFLSRSTAILATIFFLTSLSLAYMTKNVGKEKSLMESSKPTPVEQAAPKKPETDAPVVPESEVPASSSSADSTSKTTQKAPEKK